MHLARLPQPVTAVHRLHRAPPFNPPLCTILHPNSKAITLMLMYAKRACLREQGNRALNSAPLHPKQGPRDDVYLTRDHPSRLESSIPALITTQLVAHLERSSEASGRTGLARQSFRRHLRYPRTNASAKWCVGSLKKRTWSSKAPFHQTSRMMARHAQVTFRPMPAALVDASSTRACMQSKNSV